jgi:hypothetical protein
MNSLLFDLIASNVPEGALTGILRFMTSGIFCVPGRWLLVVSGVCGLALNLTFPNSEKWLFTV